MNLYSPVTEAILIFFVAAPFWHVLLMQVHKGASLIARFLAGALMAFWTAWAYAAVRYEVDVALVGDAPFRPLLFLVPVLVVAWLLRKAVIDRQVSQHVLIGLQVSRPLGLLFVLEWSRGALPGSFAHPAGWGDFAVGLLALAVVVRYWGKAIPPRAVWLVAIAGLLDFTSAIFFGVTSANGPLQLFAFDNPNRVLEYPLGLIPLFLVPYYAAAHLWSLYRLTLDRRDTSENVRPPQ